MLNVSLNRNYKDFFCYIILLFIYVTYIVKEKNIHILLKRNNFFKIGRLEFFLNIRIINLFV